MAESKRHWVERLFVEHAGPLRAFLYRRVHRHPDAAELAQEVYVRMLRVADIETIRNPEAYLYTVASNLVKEHARDERTGAGALDVDDPAIQELLAELPASGGNLTPSSASRGYVRYCISYLLSATRQWCFSTGMD